MTRDADGLVTGLGPFTLARNGPEGGLTGISGGPEAVTQSWDRSGRVADRSDVVNGIDAYRMQLTRGATGQITQKIETEGSVSHTYDYAYDPDGRLIEVRRDGSVMETYSYDADGNLVSRTIGAGPAQTATFDSADRITADGTTPYGVNADGQLTTRGADTFVYSARGELTSATVGGQTASYSYDGFGRLIARTANGQTWRYLYGNPAQQLQLTAAIEPDGTLDTLDYTDAGTVFSLLRGSTRLYVSTDQSGSARVFTDATGAVVKSVNYSAYGEVTSDSDPALVLPVGYAGGIPDALTGLVHMGLRDYDPATGRFTTRDPLLLGGGAANLFAYAAGDPIQQFDPLGLVSAGATLCEGVCVGFKWTLDRKKGLSACVEGGFGTGNGVEIDPTGKIDDNKAYFKAQLAGEPRNPGQHRGQRRACLRWALSQAEAGAKACTVGGCVSDDNITVDPVAAAGAFNDSTRALDAKVLAGVCQSLPW